MENEKWGFHRCADWRRRRWRADLHIIDHRTVPVFAQIDVTTVVARLANHFIQHVRAECFLPSGQIAELANANQSQHISSQRLHLCENVLTRENREMTGKL